jgi:coiled-coil domain-containing protein 61
MLKTAFKNESNTVNLDILTYSDLENLRSKKLSNNSSASSKFTSSFVNNNKRYLILTYNVEFDRFDHFYSDLNVKNGDKIFLSFFLE